MEGDAVIVRYEGPKGGPGMKELQTRITEIIKGILQHSGHHRRAFLRPAAALASISVP